VDLAMVSCRVMFGEIITKIGGSWLPVSIQGIIGPGGLNLVPNKIAVHHFGDSLSDSTIGDAGGSGIVGLNGRGGLWMAHLNKCGVKHCTVMGPVVEARKFGFCC
jgi:hypothetical protein